jgi:hypothetical protein
MRGCKAQLLPSEPTDDFFDRFTVEVEFGKHDIQSNYSNQDVSVVYIHVGGYRYANNLPQSKAVFIGFAPHRVDNYVFVG